MRAVGAARRGDVVFLYRTDDSWHPAAAAAEQELINQIREDLGVCLVVIGPGMQVADVRPRTTVRARRGPTPRWCNR